LLAALDERDVAKEEELLPALSRRGRVERWLDDALEELRLESEP